MADYLPVNPYQSLPFSPGMGYAASPAFTPIMGPMAMPGFAQPPMQQQPQSSGQPNYGDQLNQMLEPYQQMVSRFNSPYATGLGQRLGVNHPFAAGIVDNALLTGSMVPQGRTIGENISGVMGAMVGANQFQRQRQMQAAMLPYEMLQPRLNAENTLAQIQERQSELPYREAMEQRAMAQSDWYARRMQQPNTEEQKMQLAASMAGISGFSGDLSKLSSDQATKLNNALDTIQMRESGGLTPGRITQMLISTDPGVRAMGQKAAEAYTKLISDVSGAGSSARKSADQPQVDVDSEVKLAQSEFGAQKPMSPAEFGKLNEFNPKVITDPDTAYTQYYNQAQQNYTNAKQQYDAKVSQYRDAARKNPNLRWHDFLQQSAAGGPSGPTQGPSTGVAAPPQASGFAKWKKSQGQ